jgi:hypothetical protein
MGWRRRGGANRAMTLSCYDSCLQLGEDVFSSTTVRLAARARVCVVLNRQRQRLQEGLRSGLRSGLRRQGPRRTQKGPSQILPKRSILIFYMFSPKTYIYTTPTPKSPSPAPLPPSVTLGRGFLSLPLCGACPFVGTVVFVSQKTTFAKKKKKGAKKACKKK